MAAAAIGAIGAVAGSLISKSGSDKAASAQKDAAKIAASSEERMLERQIGLAEPWRQAGLGALPKLLYYSGTPITQEMRDAGISEYTPSGGSVLSDLITDPSYQFRLGQGEEAINRRAAAGGNRFAGSTLAALHQYGQDYASTEFNNAYQRLAGIVDMGRGVTTPMMTALANTGNSLSGIYGQLGASQASAALAGSSAISHGVQGVTGALSQYFGSSPGNYVGPGGYNIYGGAYGSPWVNPNG